MLRLVDIVGTVDPAPFMEMLQVGVIRVAIVTVLAMFLGSLFFW